MQSTFFSLVPALVAIILALWTKEVYISLIIGILSGALFYANFNPLVATEATFEVMGSKIGGNANILVFLVMLGILVALVSKSGASRAYGEKAAKTIKTRRGALAATSALGALIFVDDYFNCLTVGTVMMPITDKHKISRAKLAYIIDSTAAPVCIIAPISSWAAAVASSLPENSTIDGFSMFIKTIPFNLYAILTLVMVIAIIVLNFDFFTMKKHNDKYDKTIDVDKTNVVDDSEQIKIVGNGKVIDLVLPIGVLIISCIACMLYTGGILNGVGIATAFADCDASLSLVLGTFISLVFTFALYLPRKILNFEQFTQSFVQGFKAMTPAILILVLAWSLSGICGEGYLEAGSYVSSVVQGSNMSTAFLPAIFFLVAMGLAFSTGTSWGTMGILIPIVTAIFADTESAIMVMTISSVLAGAVCGDHISPISDTTILSSAGARCNHIEHVSTQMPYALIVAACSFVGYIIGGITNNGWIGLSVSFVILIAIISYMYIKTKKQYTA